MFGNSVFKVSADGVAMPIYVCEGVEVKKPYAYEQGCDTETAANYAPRNAICRAAQRNELIYIILFLHNIISYTSQNQNRRT